MTQTAPLALLRSTPLFKEANSDSKKNGASIMRTTMATAKFAASCILGAGFIAGGAAVSLYTCYLTHNYFVNDNPMGEPYTSTCTNSVGSLGFSKFCENLGNHKFSSLNMEDKIALGVFGIPFSLTAIFMGIGSIMIGVRLITDSFDSFYNTLYIENR